MKLLKGTSSKFFFIALISSAIFFAKQEYSQYKSQKAIESEKNKITAQIKELNEKNDQLKQSLTYLNSNSFKERLAREQLNLKKPDEQIFSFSETAAQADSNPEEKTEISNPKKWFQYFFSSQK